MVLADLPRDRRARGQARPAVQIGQRRADLRRGFARSRSAPGGTCADRWLCLGPDLRPLVVLGDDADVSALSAATERFAMATKALSFDVGDYVVYPKHGVGRVVELQSTEIAGTRLDLYVLRFEKEKMTLRVPVNKADSVGMRKLSSDKTMKDALETLTGKPKVKRTMWSRRAQA